jgi:hypothetical protein
MARTTSPLKLFKYFAREKPVIVTSELLECVAIKEVFNGDSVEALSDALTRALAAKDDPEFKTRLVGLDDQNGLDECARAMKVFFSSQALNDE